MSRESGWYRVKTHTKKWKIAEWGEHWHDGVGWMSEGEFYDHDGFYKEVDETPVNPEPADDGWLFFSLEEYDEDMNHGYGGWQLISDEFDSEESAKQYAHENYFDNYRILRGEVSTRVIHRMNEETRVIKGGE